ncbi:MAG: penicillin-binding protein 2 [Clostridia bacterium]
MHSQNPNRIKIRYNILSAVIYIIGIVLLIQLFNLQIIHGEEYREQSNTRLTRESVLKAARGNILDQSGNKLASTIAGTNLELYKSKVDTKTLNETLLKITQVLEKNGDKYLDELPITINPIAFSVSEEAANTWKKQNSIEENKTAEECFNLLKGKYKIENENIEEVRKIMTLRYAISKNGYSNTNSVKLASNISENSLAELSERNAEFPGVNLTVEPVRNYTSGNLASHILGYVSRIGEKELEGKEDRYTPNDNIGKTGIEYIFEPYLKGKDGIKQIDMAVDGTVTDEYVAKEAVAGNDVALTIDANLQKVTQTALKGSIDKITQTEKVNVTGGSAVVMNVKTGEVLAMASYPDFDPSDFTNGISTDKWNYYTAEETSEYAKNHPFVNRAISSPSSPGSTFKMVTAIAGLESGSITTKEKINDVGVYRFSSDYNPKCWIYQSYGRGHGYLNVTNAIIHSCNYFFYEVGNRTGIQTLAKYTRALGLGKKTGIELLGEEAGYVASPETSKALGQTWNGGDILPAAIGQGNNSFTTLQMAKYTSMLANGGKDVDVTIIKSVIDADGNEIAKEEIEKFVKQRLGIEEDTSEKVTFKQENLNAVLEGMKGVTTESGGTAYSIFKNFNIEVGGKTGSAQTGKKGVTNAWFVGFAPYDDPEIAVVVMIENGQHGSYAAQPARDIIAEYFGMNANKVTENMIAIPTVETIN